MIEPINGVIAPESMDNLKNIMEKYLLIQNNVNNNKNMN